MISKEIIIYFQNINEIFIQIPCFNEELQLEKTIVEIRKSVDQKI